MVIESNLNEKLGLDKPLPVQYFVFLGHVLTGDPGVSLVSGAPITAIIKEAGPKTLALGDLRGDPHVHDRDPARRAGGRPAQRPLRPGHAFLAVLAMGIPNFFLAVLLIQLFAVELRWLPVAGPGGLNHLVLPAVVLASRRSRSTCGSCARPCSRS